MVEKTGVYLYRGEVNMKKGGLFSLDYVTVKEYMSKRSI